MKCFLKIVRCSISLLRAHSLWICFRIGVVRGVCLVFAGFPVLLAIAAVTGFAVVELVLRFSA